MLTSRIVYVVVVVVAVVVGPPSRQQRHCRARYFGGVSFRMLLTNEKQMGKATGSFQPTCFRSRLK